jgi:hypothetical protein
MFAAAVPAIIAEPELAFETQTGCHSEAYGVFGHELARTIVTCE